VFALFAAATGSLLDFGENRVNLISEALDAAQALNPSDHHELNDNF
jgi:hypothetical protein